MYTVHRPYIVLPAQSAWSPRSHKCWVPYRMSRRESPGASGGKWLYTFTVRYYGVTAPVLRANSKESVPNRLNPMHMMVEVTK